ncbi:hypothetical protein ACQR1I_35500 [Bradyrhizobium sp. HKCCYLS2038]|uniref:hypothetical protein n=1 Tax=unclassified Bradyrhizobium TaxID=2631580 RepID=UPI003EB71206
MQMQMELDFEALVPVAAEYVVLGPWSHEHNQILVMEYDSQPDKLKALARKLGRTVSAVMTQASRIGAGRRNGAKVRACMCCRNPFLSEHIHNRLCVTCKSAPDAWCA